MNGLLGSELMRARSRRIARVVVIGVLVGIGVSAIILAVQSHRPTPQQLASLQAEYHQQLRACLAGQYVPRDQLPPGETLEGVCAGAIRPENFRTTGNEFALSNALNVLQGTAFLVIIGGWVLGASFAGADWSEGTFATLLAWEPRRLRVLFGRGLVTAVLVFVLAVVLQVIFVGALALVASTRGSAATGTGFFRELSGIGVRVAAAASLGSLLGLSIAMLARSTAASVGAGFAYLGVVEGLLRALRPGWQPWLLGDNLAVWVSGHDNGITLHELSLGHAGATLAVYGIALLAIAAWSFVIRDVS